MKIKDMSCQNIKILRGFTLLEMIIVMTGFFLLLTIVIQMYMRLMRSKYDVEARQNILQESYFMLEKFNEEIKDFGIDYEEYYNRSLVGCDSNNRGNNFVRDVNSGVANAHCDRFTAYGNENSYDL
ncbi:MAG: prepilin-type N-terminal cleavage/methylation domain-containing protein [bacterium]|nr:prepilin-type N-terminal cleavage/methylation domain-containing protein [bacterium]